MKLLFSEATIHCANCVLIVQLLVADGNYVKRSKEIENICHIMQFTGTGATMSLNKVFLHLILNNRTYETRTIY